MPEIDHTGRTNRQTVRQEIDLPAQEDPISGSGYRGVMTDQRPYRKGSYRGPPWKTP